jgi:MFS transporter, CP family, cyanate transporter
VPHGRTRLALALLACAIAARPLAVSVGPILPDIQADLGMSALASGILGMVPVLCLGIFAPAGVALATVLRPRSALVVALGLIVAFGVARAAAPDVVSLLVLTAGLGVGMGMAGSIPSMIIKARARALPAFMTGMYGTGVVMGAAGASVLIVPLAILAGGWREAVVLLSIVVLAAAVVGILLLGPDAPRGTTMPGRAKLPWSDRTAWQIALLFGLQSLVYWSLVIWLAEVLVASGWTLAGAGTVVGIFQLSNLVAVVAIGFVAERLGSRRTQLRMVGGAFAVGLAGLAIFPPLTIAWVIVAGIGLGAAFPLAMTLPVDYARDERDAGAKASLMLLVGYLIAAVGPPLVGLVRQSFDEVAPVHLLLAACGAGFVALTGWLRPPPADHAAPVPITTD